MNTWFLFFCVASSGCTSLPMPDFDGREVCFAIAERLHAERHPGDHTILCIKGDGSEARRWN